MKKATPIQMSGTARDVKEFKKAAEALTRVATKSRAAARDTLIAWGIYTKAGKLTKNYNK